MFSLMLTILFHYLALLSILNYFRYLPTPGLGCRLLTLITEEGTTGKMITKKKGRKAVQGMVILAKEERLVKITNVQIKNALF